MNLRTDLYRQIGAHRTILVMNRNIKLAFEGPRQQQRPPPSTDDAPQFRNMSPDFTVEELRQQLECVTKLSAILERLDTLGMVSVNHASERKRENVLQLYHLVDADNSTRRSTNCWNRSLRFNHLVLGTTHWTS